MHRTAALIIAATLTACAAPAPWVKLGATDEARARDLAECEYDATKATAGIRNAFEAGWAKADLRDQCMGLRGYKR